MSWARRLTVLFLLCGVSVATVAVAANRSWYDGAVGYGSAVRKHDRGVAPMIVYFRTDWCPHCLKFDDLLTDRKVERALRPFLKVRINPEDGKSEMDIFKTTYNGRGYPSVFVHPKGGGPPTKISAQGPPEQLIQRLSRFAD